MRFRIGPRCRRATLWLWVCLAASVSAESGTYWVSPDGQSAWPACRSDTPLAGIVACSIDTANANATAGDIVYLRGGTYSGDIFIVPANSGAPGSPITFSAYGSERVVVNAQKLPNGNHESSAWAPLNGALVEHDSGNAWDGTYSTRFTARASNQGVRSGTFTLARHRSGLGFWVTVRVYSDRPGANVQVRTVDDSGALLNKDYTLIPNQWNVLEAYVVPASSADYVLTVASPPGTTSGTWRVDGARVNPYQASIHLSGRDHVVVRGVHVESVWRGFELRNGADHNEISHSSFTDMNVYSANIIWDASGSPSRYNWIHESTFHDSGYVKRTEAGRCEDSQTLFRIGNGTSTDSSSFNLVEDNSFYHGGHDLVIIATKFNTFRNNVLHNEGWFDNREGPCQDSDGDPSTFNNPSKFGNRGLLFETPGNNGGYNLVEGNRVGFSGTPPDDDGASGIENPSDGNIVRYNFLFKNGAAGYYFKAQPGLSGTDVLPDNNRVYNNTFFANGGGTDISTGFQSGVFLSCGTAYTPTHPSIANVIKNNILYGNATAVAHSSCGGYTYVNNFEENPLFLNPDVTNPFSATLPNLTLRPGSPAIDRAEALTTVRSGDAGTGAAVAVVDARFFQDGTWGPPGKLQPDVIAVGQVGNVAQIVSVNYESNSIVLSAPLARRAGDRVWLYKKSDGATVLIGAAPDFGASESGGTSPRPPTNLQLIR